MSEKQSEKCDHYWIQGLYSKLYRCVFCDIPQNVDPKTMSINNGNHERF